MNEKVKLWLALKQEGQVVATIPKQKLKLEIEYEGNYKLIPDEIKQLLEQHNRFVRNVKVKEIKNG